jgi:hypothetical protein
VAGRLLTWLALTTGIDDVTGGSMNCVLGSEEEEDDDDDDSLDT